MKPVIIHSLANAEVEEALAWYDEQGRLLARDLKRELDTAIASIRRRPRLYPKQVNQVRKKILTSFPYSIFYEELEDAIWVIAVAHQLRQPDYWADRQFEP